MFDKTLVSQVEFDGREMKYARFGNGEKTLVIVPGLSIKSVINSHKTVAKAYKIFSKTLTVYLFDRRTTVESGITIDDMAEDTAKALRALGLENVDIFGASQGGMISMVMAIKYPELINRLALGSTAARSNEYAIELLTQWVEFAEKGNSGALAESLVRRLFSKKFVNRYGKYLANMLADCTNDELLRFASIARACETFDIYDKLNEIKCPVFVIGAEEDRVLTGEASTEIVEKLGCESYMYPPPYSHAVYDEAPDYKERLFEFFNK